MNRFRTASQTIEDIKCMNNNCLRTPSMDNTLPYLSYTHVNTFGETFTFFACDVHTKTWPFEFKLSNLPSQMASLHYEFFVKKKC